MQHADVIASTLRQHLQCPEGKTVLLTGPWGCGKTYLWEHSIKSTMVDERPVYLSLFGMDSVSSMKSGLVSECLLRKTAQLVNDRSFKKVGRTSKSLLEAMFRKGLNVLVQSELVSQIDPMKLIDDGLVICLDDIERTSSKLSLGEVFGFATHLAEAKGARVLLLANETHLLERSSESFSIMKKYKERVISYHLAARADIDSVFRKLVKKQSSETSLTETLEEHADLIKTLLHRSGSNNLRTLIRIERDLKSLIDVVGAERVSVNLVALLAALRIESDEGRLVACDSYKFSELALMMREETEDEAKEGFSQRRFHELYFSAPTYEYEFSQTIYDLVSTGFVTEEQAEKDFPSKPKHQPTEKESLLAELHERSRFFYTDKEFRMTINRIQDLLDSAEKMTTSEVMKLLIGASSSADFVDIEFPDSIGSSVRRRLKANAILRDRTFGFEERQMYLEYSKVWRRYIDEYDALLQPHEQEHLQQTLINCIENNKVGDFMQLVEGKPDALEAALDATVLGALDSALVDDRQTHYYGISTICGELSKHNEATLPEVANLRTRFADWFVSSLQGSDIGSSDLRRLSKFKDACTPWVSSAQPSSTGP